MSGTIPIDLTPAQLAALRRGGRKSLALTVEQAESVRGRLHAAARKYESGCACGGTCRKCRNRERMRQRRRKGTA